MDHPLSGNHRSNGGLGGIAAGLVSEMRGLSMQRSIRTVLREKKGVAALEYAILAGLMVLGVVAAISTTNMKTHIGTIFTNLATELQSASLGN